MCKNTFLLRKGETWSSVILSDNPNEYCKKLEVH